MRFRILLSAVVVSVAGCLYEESVTVNPAVTQRNAVAVAEADTSPIADPATESTLAETGGVLPPRLSEVTLAAPSSEAVPLAEPAKGKEPEWQSLFDGKSLKNWKSTEFGGEGEVEVKDGQIVLNFGQDMTGITWAGGELPKTNYELMVEAMKVDGTDFFAGLTFPCDDSFCSFIPGGWGGSLVGISSIDGMDASANATTSYHSFETGKWYTFRVRVTKPKLEAWIDKKQVVDTVIIGRKISIRGEVDLSKPLGISTWSTKGAIKSIKVRKLTPEEIAAAEKTAKEEQEQFKKN